MDRDDISVGLVVFIGLLVTIGAIVAHIFYVIPYIYHNMLLIVSTNALCPALGGFVAGWLNGKDNRLYVQKGFTAGALTGLAAAPFYAIVVIGFSDSSLSHNFLLRLVPDMLLVGFFVILAGGIGGLAGSALRRAIFKAAVVQADIVSEDSGAGRSSFRIYGPTFAVVTIIWCVFWLWIWLSVSR